MMTYVWIAVAGAAVCVFGWLLLKWKQRGGRGMRSLVLLLNKPRLMNENVLRRHVEMAWGIQFPEGEDAKEFVVGQKPSFVVQTRANTFLVNVFDQPYVDDPAESATQIGELRLRKAFADHRAWLSVDLLSQNERPNLQEAYHLIGLLTAELVDDDTLAIYAPQTGRINTPDPEVLERLRTDDPLQAVADMANAPVEEVSGDDPRMKQAVEEARRRFPEFVAAFRSGDGENFAVKAPFSDGEETEFMWVIVEEVDGNQVTGKLGNDPVNVKGLSIDDTVTISLDDLNDWNYFKDEKLVGGFTIKVIDPRMYDALTSGMAGG